MTDFLATTLEDYGYSVARLGFEAPDGPAQNLRVEIPGLGAAQELVVVATHFDSPLGSAGANSAATGVASLLYLARTFLGKRPFRTLHLVWFSHHYLAGRETNVGSRYYVENWEPHGRTLRAALVVESLGCFRPGSAQPGPSGTSPIPADFLELRFMGDEPKLFGALRNSLVMEARIPVEFVEPAAHAEFRRTTDAQSFADGGTPTVLLSDTGAQRCATHGTAEDTPRALEVERFAHVASLLPDAVLALTGPLGDPL
jgi:Zn-dependent M28 family amino/carboxypeptidase